MKKLILFLAFLLAMGAAPASRSTDEAAYNADITQRAEKHVAALNLDDAEKVARVRLVLPGGDTVTGRPTEGLFVLAVPRTHLRPERQHAFVVGLDRHGRRTQRFGVLFRANA